MSDRDPRLEWIHGYVAGTITPGDLAALERALREDAAFRARFLDYLDVDLALSLPRGPLAARAATKAAPVARFPSPRFRLLAAAAIVLLCIGIFRWQRGGSPVSDPASFPAIVVNQSLDARWVGPQAPRGVGHGVNRARQILAAGEATFQLDNGVELQLRAPAELQLHSAAHGTLFRGSVSARVPDGATGFRLDAPGAEVVDLGTEFSLVVNEAGPPAVHVFKGRVQASLPATPASLMELGTGESARFDLGLGQMTRSSEDPALFPLLQDETNLPRTTGEVRYLRRAPASVESGTFEHDAIVVFSERKNFALPADLTAIRRISYQQAAPEPSVPEKVVLSSGTRVDCYFVHLDRVGSEQDEITSEGTIVFDRPILGLVMQYYSLATTDPWLAHEGTRYERRNIRLLEMRFMGRATTTGLFDEVHIGADGRTLRLVLRMSTHIDQLRVLVAAEGDR